MPDYVSPRRSYAQVASGRYLWEPPRTGGMPRIPETACTRLSKLTPSGPYRKCDTRSFSTTYATYTLRLKIHDYKTIKSTLGRHDIQLEENATYVVPLSPHCTDAPGTSHSTVSVLRLLQPADIVGIRIMPDQKHRVRNSIA